MQFPLLGLARDFHPLDNAHAERTKNTPTEHVCRCVLLYLYFEDYSFTFFTPSTTYTPAGSVSHLPSILMPCML